MTFVKLCYWKILKWCLFVDPFDLGAKRGSIVLKTETDKLDVKKLVNIPTCLNNFKTKVEDLDVDKLKTVPAD